MTRHQPRPPSPSAERRVRRWIICTLCGQRAELDFFKEAPHISIAKVRLVGGYGGIEWHGEDLTPEELAIVEDAVRRLAELGVRTNPAMPSRP